MADLDLRRAQRSGDLERVFHERRRQGLLGRPELVLLAQLDFAPAREVMDLHRGVYPRYVNHVRRYRHSFEGPDLWAKYLVGVEGTVGAMDGKEVTLDQWVVASVHAKIYRDLQGDYHYPDYLWAIDAWLRDPSGENTRTLEKGSNYTANSWWGGGSAPQRDWWWTRAMQVCFLPWDPDRARFHLGLTIQHEKHLPRHYPGIWDKILSAG